MRCHFTERNMSYTPKAWFTRTLPEGTNTMTFRTDTEFLLHIIKYKTRATETREIQVLTAVIMAITVLEETLCSLVEIYGRF
jgi:hypothetical protein